MKKLRLLNFVGSIGLLATACGDKLEVSENSNSKTKDNTTAKRPSADVSQVELVIKPNLKSGSPFIKASDLNVNNVIAEFKNPLDAAKYNFRIDNVVPFLDANGKDVSDAQAKIQFRVSISAKSNPNQFVEKLVTVSEGLTPSRSGYIDQDFFGRFGPRGDLVQYSKLDRYQQFTQDNHRYLEALKSAIAFNLQGGSRQFDISKFRTEVQTTQTEKTKFDQKAAQLHLNTYDDSLVKGFAVPVYDEQAQVKGINLYNNEMNKFPSWRDLYGRDPYKTDGLPRVLPNEKYKDIALQTYAVSIDNLDRTDQDLEKAGKFTTKRTRGTAWILDYQKRDGDQYPTRWYLGTNLHVADALTNDTTGVSFSILKKDVAIKTKIKPADGVNETYFDNFYIPNLKVVNGGVAVAPESTHATNHGQQLGIRTVFTGDDYLKKDPKDYLVPVNNPKDDNNTDYQNYHEFLDFAVIEIDFAALWATSINNHEGGLNNNHNFSTPEEYAKAFTREYATNREKHIKFLKKSYLSDYARVNYPLFNPQDPTKPVELKSFDTMFLLGYPLSKGDWGLDMYEDEGAYKNKGNTVSLWVNGEGGWFENPASISGERAVDAGDQLSTNVGYQTFTNKPGVVDAFISASRAGKDFYFSPHHRNAKRLIGFGLEYVPRHYAPYGGSSGSSMRNQNNELVGVFHVGNNIAKAGLAAAFRSEGYDYQGLYGQYHLPQYDLIYGGGKEQQKSFRESLLKLYGSSYSTNLFSNINQIPAGYEFTQTNPSNPS